MKLTTTQLPLGKIETEALVVPLFENEVKNLPESLEGLVKLGDLDNEFSAKIYETFFIPGRIKNLLVGAGVPTVTPQ